jgi:hypothetical protein
MASLSRAICNPIKWGLKDGYTLLGSKYFINFFENNLSCILLKNTNAVVKIGRRMCVTCLGNNQHTHSNHTWSSAPLHNLTGNIAHK